MPQEPTPTPRNSLARQNQILKKLEQLGVNYSTCVRCKAQNPPDDNLHELTEVSETFNIKIDKIASREHRERGYTTSLHSRRCFNLVYITCKRCGFKSEFDMDRLLKKPQPPTNTTNPRNK